MDDPSCGRPPCRTGSNAYRSPSQFAVRRDALISLYVGTVHSLAVAKTQKRQGARPPVTENANKSRQLSHNRKSVHNKTHLGESERTKAPKLNHSIPHQSLIPRRYPFVKRAPSVGIRAIIASSSTVRIPSKILQDDGSASVLNRAARSLRRTLPSG